MQMIGSAGQHMFGSNVPFMGQIVACYRRGGCTPEGIPVNRTPEWWGVKPENSAEKNALIEKNGLIIWETLSEYPFPAPFDPGEGVVFFFTYLHNDLIALANADSGLDPDIIRIWITLQILAQYENWVAIMQQNLERMARRRKRVAFQRAIAVAVGSLVMGIAAPAAVAALLSAVQTATQTYIDVQKAKNAAKALAEAAAAFEESDPKFAEELRRAEEVMELIEANEPKEATEQIQQANGLPVEASGEGGPSPLLIGGGIAAGGLALLALLS